VNKDLPDGVREAIAGEVAPMKLIKTHLTFGDAQTQAMLDLAGFADKDYGVVHRTDMSYGNARIPPISPIGHKQASAISDRLLVSGVRPQLRRACLNLAHGVSDRPCSTYIGYGPRRAARWGTGKGRLLGGGAYLRTRG
jgi:hypothetical protein